MIDTIELMKYFNTYILFYSFDLFLKFIDFCISYLLVLCDLEFITSLEADQLYEYYLYMLDLLIKLIYSLIIKYMLCTKYAVHAEDIAGWTFKKYIWMTLI